MGAREGGGIATAFSFVAPVFVAPVFVALTDGPAASTSSSSCAYIPSSDARKTLPAASAASAARRSQTTASCRSPRAQSALAVESPHTTSSTSSGRGSGKFTESSAIKRPLSQAISGRCGKFRATDLELLSVVCPSVQKTASNASAHRATKARFRRGQTETVVSAGQTCPVASRVIDDAGCCRVWPRLSSGCLCRSSALRLCARCEGLDRLRSRDPLRRSRFLCSAGAFLPRLRARRARRAYVERAS